MNQRPARGGLTLLEVILALAVAGAAIAVISQVAWSGLENARMAQELVQAEFLAQNIMAELQKDIRPLDSVRDASFTEEDGLEDPQQWVYSVEVMPAPVEGLLDVRVTVRAESKNPRKVEYTLARWLRDPQFTGEQTPEIPSAEYPYYRQCPQPKRGSPTYAYAARMLQCNTLEAGRRAGFESP